MPSSYTSRLRLELQAAGENLNSWGAPRLNNALSRIDFAVAGRTPVILAGVPYLLTASNGDDEARAAILDMSGTGPATVTVPSVSKTYLVRNGASGAVTLTTGAGSTVVLGVGDVALVFCDGTNLAGPTIGGVSIKAYVDAQAWAGATGNLPGQTGSAGKYLQTNGTVPSWVSPVAADISDLAAQVNARAIAFAIAL